MGGMITLIIPVFNIAHRVVKIGLSQMVIFRLSFPKGEQMVRYYGYYSNVCRGKRQKAGTDAAAPCILEVRGDVKAFRRSWARLIQKIYEVDHLACPKSQGPMRIISFIEDREVGQ